MDNQEQLEDIWTLLLGFGVAGGVFTGAPGVSVLCGAALIVRTSAKLHPDGWSARLLTGAQQQATPLLTQARQTVATLPEVAQAQRVGRVDLATIVNDDNILVVGPKGSGKTTLLKLLIEARTGHHIALDPHNTPAKWPCRTVGGGLEYADIAQILSSSYSQMRKRYQAMAKGTITEEQCKQRRYTLVADEYRSISKALTKGRGSIGASEILLEILTQGRKAGLSVLVASHADTVEALGIQGEGDLRTSFDWIIYLGAMAVRKLPAARAMTRPAVAYHPERDDYHLLTITGVTRSGPADEAPDHSSTLAAMLEQHPGETESSRCDDELQGSCNEFQASQRGVAGPSSVAETGVSPAEMVQIVLKLQQGMTPAQVAKALPGYNGRNYKAYKARVDQVQALVDRAADGETDREAANDDEPDVGPFGRYL